MTKHKRFHRFAKVMLALLMAGSAILSAHFSTFLKNGGLKLLSTAKQHSLEISRSKMKALAWTGIIVGDRGSFDVSLSWDAQTVSRDRKNAAEPGSYEITPRWVSNGFSLQVTQWGDSSGDPRGFAEDILVGNPSSMTYSDRLGLYSASAGYVWHSFDTVLKGLSRERLQDESWETIILGSVQLIIQVLKQGLIVWQIPVLALMPERWIPGIVWGWSAVLAALSLGLLRSLWSETSAPD